MVTNHRGNEEKKKTHHRRKPNDHVVLHNSAAHKWNEEDIKGEGQRCEYRHGHHLAAHAVQQMSHNSMLLKRRAAAF
jgi:hypothetical protein